MKFGNRMSGEAIKTITRRRVKYFEHLERLRFRPSDVLMRFFATEVFHDSPIRDLNVDLPHGSVDICLSNVHASDLFSKSAAIKGETSSDSPEFTVRVIFKSVRDLRVSIPLTVGEAFYHQAEIDRVGSHIVIRIQYVSGFHVGLISLTFAALEVETIVPRPLTARETARWHKKSIASVYEKYLGGQKKVGTHRKRGGGSSVSTPSRRR